MAKTRADLIAAYLEELVRQGGGAVEIQRGALAARFGCAPSQVNYVLATRFTLDRGYVLESRPGQGGYIRVRVLSTAEWRLLVPRSVRQAVLDNLGAQAAPHVTDPTELAMSQDDAALVTQELRQAGLLTEREAAMLRAMLRRDVLRIALPERDRLRARLLRAAVLACMPGTPASEPVSSGPLSEPPASAPAARTSGVRRLRAARRTQIPPQEVGR